MIETIIIIGLLFIIFGLTSKPTKMKTSNIKKSPNSLIKRKVEGYPSDNTPTYMFWDYFQSPSLEVNGRTYTEVSPNIYLGSLH
jgi:hypothetical protein